MKIAFYIAKDRLFNRVVGNWLRGPSHCEAIVRERPDGTMCCWSASYMDNGVRYKEMRLNPNKWVIVDVPWAQPSLVEAWFEKHNGEPYDLVGLLGFPWRPIQGEKNKWFCSEAIAASLGFPEPFRFDPATLLATVSREVP